MIGLVVTALAPILFVVGLGWLAGATKAMPGEASGYLATFVVRYALPISLFLAAAKASPAEMFNPGFLATLGIGLIVPYVISFFTARLAFGRDKGEAALAALGCSFPNMAYCGPPVLVAVLGAGGLLPVVVGNLLTSVILVPATLIIAASTTHGHRGVGRVIWQAVSQPLVFLPVLGAIVAIVGIPLPKPASDAADAIGRSAAGVALFTLGLILANARFSLGREVMSNVLTKNIVQPASMLGVGWLLALDATMLKMVLLTAVLPSATEVAALSIANETYAEVAPATTMASTFFAVISIAVGVAIASHLG